MQTVRQKSVNYNKNKTIQYNTIQYNTIQYNTKRKQQLLQINNCNKMQFQLVLHDNFNFP